MARVALALILAFGAIGISHGYEFRSAKDYVTRMYKKASSFVVKQEEPTTDDSLGPVKCDEDGLFPNPFGCDSYIKCTNGVYYILPCGNDKHFNDQTKRCEDRCSADCDDSLACECDWDSCQTTTVPNDLYAETTFEPTAESTEISRKSFSRSKKVLQFTCSRDGLYPYPYDCASYIQCSNGQAYTMPCPRGLHFNRKSQRCESPCDARCDPTIADQCGWDDSMKVRSVRQPLYDFTCIKDGLYRNPEDCGTYIQCSNGNAYVMSCPHNLHFSEETERCEAQCDARCDPSIAEECGWEVTTTPSYSSEVCTLPRYKGPCDAYMTRHYYDNSDGKCKKFIFGGCRSNGNNFRTKEECLRTCVYPMQNPISDFQCPRDGLYPYPEDCSKYVQCSNGQIYVMPCPENLHFSLESMTCEPPCDAKCDLSLEDECGWESGVTEERSAQEPTEESWRYNDDRSTQEPTEDSWGYTDDRSPQEPTENSWWFKKDRSPQEPTEDSWWFKKSRSQQEPTEDSRWFMKFRSPQEPTEETWGYTEDRSPQEPTEEDSWGYTDDRSPQEPTEDSWLFKKFRSPQEPTEDSWGYTDDRSPQEPTEDSWGYTDDRSPQEPTEDSWWFKKVKSPQEPTEEPWGYTDDRSTQEPTEDSWGYTDDRSPQEPTENSRWFKKNRSPQEPTEDSWWFKKNRSPQEPTENSWEYTTDSSPQEPTENSWGYTTEVSAKYSKIMKDFSCIRDGLYPNPQDCATYIQCSNGYPYVMPCPKNLHFNPDAQRCESPCDAHCDASLACDCEWPECREEDSDIDCEVEPEVGHCEDRLRRYYYNRENGRCTLFYYGGCGGNSNNFRTLKECQKKCQTKLIGGFKCPAYTGNFGRYPDCMTYYQCKKGIPTLKTCPRGTAFHHKKAKCVAEHEAVCVYVCRESDAVYPVEEDCHKYIDCVNGVSKLEKCPRGQAFDPEKENCVEEETVSCARR